MNLAALEGRGDFQPFERLQFVGGFGDLARGKLGETDLAVLGEVCRGLRRQLFVIGIAFHVACRRLRGVTA